MKFLIFALLALTTVGHCNERSLSDDGTLSSLRNTMPGQTIELTDVELGQLGTVTLQITRFKVFAEDAQVITHGDNGTSTHPMPNNNYFIGTIKGLKDSRIFIGLLANGKIEGVVETANGNKQTLSWQQKNQFKLNKPSTASMVTADSRFYNPKDYIQIPESEIKSNRSQTSPPRGPAIDYQLTVAIETDYEFYQIFNDAGDEVNYITGLIGYLSSMYYNEINTFVLVGNISLWTTSSDPWEATNSGCALFEVGKYWNDNNANINRATTHFLSGKSLGGGIAWEGVLCNGGFNFNISAYGCGFPDNGNYGGAYGVSGGLSGAFNPNNPQPIWDIVVTSHEIGHNFNSPHTHCYNGIGGNSNPVDQCYNADSGCYSGAESLPGPSGLGSGTIMSYCHLLSGGLSNISLTLGTNHPYGVQPERVPNRMRAHVESMANINPQCIIPAANDLIFIDGFE